MAVKKVKTNNSDVVVETPVVDEDTLKENDVTEDVQEDKTEDDVEENKESDVQVETPQVEIEVEQTTNTNSVDIQVENTEVNKSNKPTGLVRIKMRADHKCCIAMERYDLKKDKVYTVPENVKRILNNAGLLAPL